MQGSADCFARGDAQECVQKELAQAQCVLRIPNGEERREEYCFWEGGGRERKEGKGKERKGKERK